ncbi:hypothetical protein MGYG_01160 [Nannizzia gypsea CBS 118893]|uniref:Uncharacterized protein n=1 Tax=Arthroderma gypseum (strain ATCC MYA-4604 / CBS 118893) TaxID=535722 RepID=E5QYZ9_ARTGP|nr:hypothetical protein MGYG_01160 [Nannizzia gypsea CBS 118893]EFQ98122.1 hypothetical protein MGYG_01160 [Nannizzia gypsea CBS 118893]
MMTLWRAIYRRPKDRLLPDNGNEGGGGNCSWFILQYPRVVRNKGLAGSDAYKHMSAFTATLYTCNNLRKVERSMEKNLESSPNKPS